MSPSPKERKPSLRSIKSKLFVEFLDDELTELTRVKRLVRSGLKIAVMVARDFMQNLVKLQAMALAFKTLLSLAPLLAVVFALLKAFGVHNRLEPALAEALAPLGDKGNEISAHLVGFVNNMNAGAIGSIGLVTLFVTVLSLMGTIEEAFNRIWRVKSPRKLARRFSDYLSAILVGPVLVFAAVTATATLQNNAIVRFLLSLEALGAVILFLLRLLPYFTLWCAFTFVYLFIPNTRVALRSAVVGGLVAAILWQTVGWGFAVFVASSSRYYVIYSSFAILFLFLIWLHIGWLIVLLGAQVAYAHQYIHYFLGNRELLAQTPAGREKLALHMMMLIGRNFSQGRDPLNVAALAAQLRVPAGVVKEFMSMLADLKLVLPLSEEDTYVLARDPKTIAIKEIIDCVRNSGRAPKIQPPPGKEENVINEILGDLDHAAAKALEGKSLEALLRRLSPEGRR